MRWIDVGDDHLVYLRESNEQRLLVHVARAAHDPVRVPLSVLPATDASAIAGDSLTVAEASLRLDADGPTWRIVELG